MYTRDSANSWFSPPLNLNRDKIFSLVAFSDFQNVISPNGSHTGSETNQKCTE